MLGHNDTPNAKKTILRSLWFYVDYRALNNDMIPDKYPIIIVDELLDKLFGDTVFFKFDLKPEYHHISV